jgi:hypothetical protein
MLGDCYVAAIVEHLSKEELMTASAAMYEVRSQMNYLQSKNRDPDKYNHSGIYELKCNSCQLKYIGQTGRNFRTRYREHIHAIHSNKTTSKYAQHILDTGHAYGTLENTFNVLHFLNKGPQMNSLERFYIYRLRRDNLNLNDTYTDISNPIYNLVTEYYK